MGRCDSAVQEEGGVQRDEEVRTDNAKQCDSTMMSTARKKPKKMCRAVENAIRGCGPCQPELEPAGGGVEDVLMEVKDLSTGVYGEPYKVV